MRVPGRTDGVSFAPLLADPAGPPVRRSLLLEQAAGPKIQSDRVYTPNYCGLRTARYTFVHYADGEQELYDDRHDPYQLSNLAGDPRWQREAGRLAVAHARPVHPGAAGRALALSVSAQRGTSPECLPGSASRGPRPSPGAAPRGRSRGT